MELSRKHDLTVIEDAAESQGALYRGRQTGSIGDMGCFSFYANKIITTGEGGMVTADDEELDHKLRSLKNLAFGDTARYTHTDLGYNYRMPNVLAAIGLAQMGRVNELIEKKRKIADWYKDGLSQAEGLELPTEKPWARNVYWMFGIVLDRSAGLNRNSLMRKLSRSGVETRAFFVPMHKQRVFHSIGLFKGLRLPVSERLSEGGLYLPSGATLTRREVEYVCQQVISALSHR
jgi:perosamine synthetase